MALICSSMRGFPLALDKEQLSPCQSPTQDSSFVFDVLKRSCREPRHESRHHTLREVTLSISPCPTPTKYKTKRPPQKTNQPKKKTPTTTTTKKTNQKKEAEDQSLLRTIQAKLLLFTIFHGDSIGFSQASEGGDLGEGSSLAGQFLDVVCTAATAWWLKGSLGNCLSRSNPCLGGVGL